MFRFALIWTKTGWAIFFTNSSRHPNCSIGSWTRFKACLHETRIFGCATHFFVVRPNLCRTTQIEVFQFSSGNAKFRFWSDETNFVFRVNRPLSSMARPVVHGFVEGHSGLASGRRPVAALRHGRDEVDRQVRRDLGSMLWSLFSTIFAIFGEKFGVFLKNQCYDHNFRQFSAKKFGAFLKNQSHDQHFGLI
jgi:hypothetical protein